MKPEGPTAPPPPESELPLHERTQRRNTTFKGDVLRLVSGTGLAQILTILAAPILTRLYAPEAFGMAALFASITGILGVLACMRYELSIVLPDNDREAANLLGVSLCFALLIALLAVPIVGYGGPQILQWVGMLELAPYLWLVPITVFINGVFLALNYWNTRTKHFTRLSIARVTSAVATNSATLGAGFAGHATGGAMIAASVGGQAVATTVLGGQIYRDNGRFLVQSITWHEMWAGVKKYKRFPMISSWSALMNTASIQVPTLLLGFFFNSATVGFYAIGYRLLSLPVQLIGSSVSQVFFQRAAIAKHIGDLSKIVQATFAILLIISVFPFFLLMSIGPALFSFVLGADWRTAGIYVQILSPWIFFVFLTSPISSLINILEVQEVALIQNILLIITRVASIIIGGIAENILLALILFSISGVLIKIWYCYYLICKSNAMTIELWKATLPYVAAGIFFVSPTILGQALLDISDGMLAAIVAISTVAYYGSSWVLYRRCKRII